MKDKFILDAGCGSRMFWINKNHPNTIYIDKRKEPKGFIKTKPNLEINPDIICDITKLPKELKSKRFKLIIWDTPHFKAKNLTGIMLKQYGSLNPETWKEDLKNSFNELWGILDNYGILLFKFANYHIKFKEVLELFPEKPLIYNKTSSKGNSSTKWFCFMKITEIKSNEEKKE